MTITITTTRTMSCQESMEKSFRTYIAVRTAGPQAIPSNSAVDIYRSPASGRITTIVFPANPGSAASRAATATAAPLEMPAMMPSSRARRRAISIASAVSTGSRG